MPTSIQHIASIIAPAARIVRSAQIEHLLTDSRKLIFRETSLFFAIDTVNQDGHLYIKELAQKGVYNFVVDMQFDTTPYNHINFLVVDHVVHALQLIAKDHREQFDYPVIGITGSNGKTIVKEWLAQLLSHPYHVVRSPRSYNSQIGVPLSVWEMNNQYDLGIFEAGISQKGEMDSLESVIQPTLGILTNIATAHEEGFINEGEKLIEKCRLFKNAKQVIIPHELLGKVSLNRGQSAITWGAYPDANLYIQAQIIQGSQAQISAVYNTEKLQLLVPFTDQISIDNTVICWATLLHLGVKMDTIQQGVNQLSHLEMRMQIKKGQNQCYLLNDSYSNDIYSLLLALDYAKQQAGNLPITVILSDFTQSQIGVFEQLVQKLMAYPRKKLIGIGPKLAAVLKDNSSFKKVGCMVQCYNTTTEFLSFIDTANFKEEFIVLKGARAFEFERINSVLQLQVHQTQVEVNLTALLNNYKTIKTLVGPTVKLMAMVKAFGYGSGSIEVARVLQFHHADYLSVAYADEGVELRKAGIHLPIMVMNVDAAAFSTLIQYHLEPEIFSLSLLEQFIAFIQSQALRHFPVHLKLNTGMNRLGFDMDQMEALCTQIKSQEYFKVQTIFSHLAASGQSGFEDFTEKQLADFNIAAQKIETALGYAAIKHIANSGAILMHKKYHLDMVRLGIGLYGIAGDHAQLQTVVQLQTTIAQIRQVPVTETIGYNRAGQLTRDSLIATVRLGYADGYSRKLGRGKGFMWVQGKLAPVVGDICMDMAMIDITDIPSVKEGDLVEVFGTHLPIEQVAKWAETIPYEILTSIGQRVKRIYIQD